MPFHTSHAALLALGGTLLAATLTPICGHNIDPNIFNVTTAFTIIITVVDWTKRHFGKGAAITDPLAVQG